jgi:predicted membrane metal-binding protein
MRNPLPSDRSFGLTFAVVFGLIGVWLVWQGGRYWFLAVGIAALFLLAALALPRVLHPLNVVWMWLGHLLNRVVSPIVMGLIFFGLLTPVAWLMRLRGRDVLHRKFDAKCSSYWVARDPPGPDGSSFPRQY